jgi:hypothetical protein
MMGSSMVLAASRQSFAFARDGALPFSSYLYRMNRFTKTPVNTVWFVVAFAIVLGLLSFAGAQAINAIFSISVTALYIAYAIPITARFAFKNDFKPGPFSLGIFVSCRVGAYTCWPLIRGFEEPTGRYHCSVLHGIHGHRLLLSDDATDRCFEHELHGGCSRWYAHLVYRLVLFPVYGGVHWFTGPVPNIGKLGEESPSSRESVEKMERVDVKEAVDA